MKRTPKQKKQSELSFALMQIAQIEANLRTHVFTVMPYHSVIKNTILNNLGALKHNIQQNQKITAGETWCQICGTIINDGKYCFQCKQELNSYNGVSENGN